MGGRAWPSGPRPDPNAWALLLPEREENPARRPFPDPPPLLTSKTLPPALPTPPPASETPSTASPAALDSAALLSASARAWAPSALPTVPFAPAPARAATASARWRSPRAAWNCSGSGVRVGGVLRLAVTATAAAGESGRVRPRALLDTVIVWKLSSRTGAAVGSLPGTRRTFR